MTRIPFIMLGSVLFLSACSPYHSDFDCPVGEGLRCASLSQVDKAINRGQVNLNEEDLFPVPQTPSSLTSGPVKIWIAPRLDERGAYQPSQWVTS